MAASSSSSKKGGPAIGKRARISKAQRNMLIAIGLASVVFGITIVGVVYIARVMKFNSLVKEKKVAAIKQIKGVQDSLVQISDDVSRLSGDDILEVVARQRSRVCEGETLKGFEYSLANISLARTCTSIRVIPDAMPAVFNQEAALASLNQLILWSNNGIGTEFTGLAVEPGSNIPSRLQTVFATDSANAESTMDEDGNNVPISGIGAIVNFEDSATKIYQALDAIENSIRPFDIESFSIDWGGNSVESQEIELSAVYISYYTNRKNIEIKKKSYCADGESKKCNSGEVLK